MRRLLALLLFAVPACAGWDRDRDRDGHLAPLDCDDDDAAVHPAAAETCGNGVDDDCDGRAVGCGLAGWTDLTDADARVVGLGEDDGVMGVTVGAGDLDGDGRTEVLIRDHQRRTDLERVWVLRGPLSAETSLSDRAPAWEHGGSSSGPVAAGDLDGDGHPDIVLGVGSDDGQGELRVYGSATDTALGEPRAVVTLTSTFDSGRLAYAGDVDGDGLGDLVAVDVYAPMATGDGAAWILPGTTTGQVDVEAVAVPIAGTNTRLNGGVAAGDFDGDGLGDVAVEVGHVAHVFFGPIAPGSFPDADATVCCGFALAAGDVDGDGLADLFLGAPQDAGGLSVADEVMGAAYLFHAPFADARDLATAAATIRGAPGTWYSGEIVAVPGDLDGDGRAEVALSGDTGWGDAAFVFRGGLAGTFTTTGADAVLSGREMSPIDGIAGAGDTDGDGFPDLLVLAPWADRDDDGDREGVVALLLGGPGF